MKKIVIAGASVFGLDNLSDDAMFTVFCRELHRNIDDLEIVLLARHPSDGLDSSYKLRSIQNLDHQTKEESIGRWFNELNPDDSTEHLHRIYREIRDCDLVVVGGEPFIDISLGLYRGPTPYAALVIILAKFHQKPVMINGIHMGRLLINETAIQLANFCISNSDVVTIREETTRPIIREMGIKTDHLITLADPAYGLNPFNDKSAGKEILRKENIQFKSDKIVGITFRHMYWKWSESVWDGYSTIVAELCDYIIEKYGVDVLFIPHNTYTSGLKYENDFPAHREIVAKIKNSEHAHQISNRYNVYETLSLFPLFDMVFSNRRHTLIFAAIHGVPGLGVGEELHVKVTMEELLLGGENFINIENFDPDKIKESLDVIWSMREGYKEKVDKVLPDLKARALKHARVAADIVCKKR